VIEAAAPRRVAARTRPRIRAQLGALVYLQLRTALRKWQLIARDPLRRLAWAPYAASVVWFTVARLTNLHVRLPESMWQVVGALLPAFIFLLIAMSRAAGGRLYQSRAHAHLVGGLGLRVWLLVAWQHLQRLPVTLWNFALFGVLLLPSLLGVGPVRVFEAAFAILLALLFVGGAGLISFAVRLRSNRFGQVWTAAALAIAGILALPSLQPALGQAIAPLQTVSRVAEWTPGGLVAMAAAGNLAADLLLLVIAAAVLALGIAVTSDLGPQLAEASYRYFTLMDSARAGGNAGMSGANMRLRDPVQKSTSTRLRGAGVMAWKTWLEFKRGGTGRWRLVTFASQIAFGVVLGWVWIGVQHAHRSSSLITIVIAAAVFSVVAFGFSSGRQFGPLLRNPLFALNRDSLASRLLAFLLTRQTAESIGSVATIAGLALMLPQYLPVIVVLILVTRAVAIGMLGLDLFVFAWLPSATDRTMALRIIRGIILAVTVPVGTVFVIWAFTTPAPDLVLLVPIPLFLGLGWWLIVLAGSRLEGNGLAVAIAERR
jgi:hypothetical protein